MNQTDGPVMTMMKDGLTSGMTKENQGLGDPYGSQV
jgi:hypothetical protein